ncbi:MAG: hypothetical protein ABI665_09370 [Vicinamibacterales bacterium]
MSATGEEALAVLKSIDATLKAMLALAQRRTAATRQATVASDRDLDGKYGNPKVKFMPRDWTGPSFKDYQFSECPPALLDMLSETLDYFAQKAEETNEQYNGKPTAPYKRSDAARARGWAHRIRSGQYVQAPAAEPGATDSEWAEDPAWR